MSRFYITTPIYYINAEPHLGHAYTTMVADAIARSRRLLNQDVFFLTGTDEHGQKVERAAKKAGLETPAFAVQIAAKYRELFAQLNISNDDFIRTTEDRHKRAAQAIWRRVRDRGFLYKSSYEGWYCTVDELFVPETQLVDGKRCPTCGNAVERLSEESYFFQLSKFQEPLLEHYRANPGFIAPDIRRNEMIAFVSAGLRDLSVSRTSFKWGIPVPDDPDHVMYVWFDALTNYITAVGFPDDEARMGRYWPADVHLMGKEIVRQHTVYWPAFLMAAGLPLPRQIIGHGWWLMNDAKMSKSIGNIVRPQGYIERFGVDALRYFVMREMVVGQDANFADDTFLGRYNADLANDLGNVVSRVATMIQRYCGGVIPVAVSGDQATLDLELRTTVEQAIEKAIEDATRFDFSASLRQVWDLISSINKYIVVREPWALAKDPASRPLLDTTLYQAADALRVVAALTEPVMPSTATRIRRMLGIGTESWVDLRPGTLAPGSSLGPVEPLFPRMEYTVDQLRAMSTGSETGPSEPTAQVPSPAPSAPVAAANDRITIDDFMKVDLRVAKVLTAEKVPNSRKLVKLSIDAGTEQRTLVAGIAEAYEPEQLVGRTVVIVFNLKPAKLMGIESNGMVLAASPDGGKPTLIGFDQDVAPGTRVRQGAGLIDSHCHLAGDDFETDLHAVVDRARNAGLTGALVILSAADAGEGQRARRVREAWPDVRFAVGIHPHQAGLHAADTDGGVDALRGDLSAHDAVAVGEIGLDYHYDFSPRDVQQEVFRRQIALARERGLPIVIHTREATDDTFRILREDGDGVRTVFHCFTGGAEMATAALEVGAWLSFAGIVTFPRAAELREVVRMVPADRFLVETDSPYLAPVPHRGKRNEPAFVTRVVEAIAEVRNESPARVAAQTTENFTTIFSGL